MHIGPPLACFSSDPPYLIFSTFYRTLIILMICKYPLVCYCPCGLVGVLALLSIRGDGNGLIFPMSPWYSLWQSPRFLRICNTKTSDFIIHLKLLRRRSADITQKCEEALVTAWSQMPRKPAKPRVSGRALSIFKPGVQFDHCDQRFLPLVNSWCTVERITTEAPVYEFYSNSLWHFN